MGRKRKEVNDRSRLFLAIFNLQVAALCILRLSTYVLQPTSADDCTYYWLNGVAATGTFTRAESMEDWTTGASGIPSGWTVNNIP